MRDGESKDIKIEPVISPDLRTEGIANVRSSNVDGCKCVAKKIVDQVLTKGALSLDFRRRF